MKVHNKILKAFGALLIAALLFGAMPAGEVKAQTGQDLYVAEWSELATISGFSGRPIVVHDGTTYHMWYGPSDNELYHTSSIDPSSFPVGNLTTFDSVPYEVSSPAIVYEGGVFYLITYKIGTDLVFSMYTSSNGVNWTYKGDVYDGTGLGTQGTDWRKIDAPTLLSDNGTYKLYFQVAPVSGDYKIYLAETGATTLAAIADDDNDNDFTLANSNSPVLTVGEADTPDETHVQHPMVVKDGDTYFMLYTGVASGTYYWRSINLATSPDGVAWTKSPANPVWFDTYSSAEPTVVKIDGVWHLWFEANENRIDYLSASGPFEFQTIQSAIDAASDGDTINVASGTYDESLNINKSVTLQGPGAVETFTDPLVVNDWYTDRYEPGVFEVDTFLGESVLKHGIRAVDLQGSAFYNTQGRKYDVNLIGSTQVVNIDMFVGEDWGTETRYAGLWATGFDSTNTVSAYPIIAWRNAEGDGPGFFAYDYFLGEWIKLRDAVPEDYGKWHNLAFELTVGTGVEYFIDGESYFSFADPDTISLGNVILNAKNFGEDYDVYWDNFGAWDAKVVGQMDIDASNVGVNGLILSNPSAQYGMQIDALAANIDITNNLFADIGSELLTANVKGIYLVHGSDNVTIENNLFERIKANESSVNAIFSGDSNSTDPAQGLVIKDNRFQNITSQTKGGYGILLNNGAGNPTALIDGNRFSGISGGGWNHAVGMEGPTPSAVVTDNTFYNLTSGSADNSAVFFEANPHGGSVDVSGNRFQHEGLGVAIHPNDLPGGVNGLEYTVDASPNWWGSINGPAIDQFYGDITYSPWCGDVGCTFLNPQDIGPGNNVQTILGGAPSGMIFNLIPGEVYPGGLIINNPGLTINLNGATIGPGSPAFTVNADNTIINGPGTLNGFTGDPLTASTSHAVEVADGVTNFTLNNAEILGWADGIHFTGVINNTVIADNFIHDNTGDAIYFGAQPVDQTGVSFYVQGNLFKNNGGLGVNNAIGTEAIDATYNAWGDFEGPTGADGDGVSANVTYDPFTHVDLYMVSSTNELVDEWPHQVFVDGTISYEVKANMVNLTGADFVLDYPETLVDITDLTLVTSNFQGIPRDDGSGDIVRDLILVDDGDVITFAGETALENYGAITADEVLFSFTVDPITYGAAVFDFDEVTNEFSMSPSYGPSNNIYADELVDATLNIITRPTLEITGLDTPFVAGVMSHEITNEICNPTTGGDWSESPTEPDAIGWIRISDITLAEIASLQFLYDGVWYDFEVQDAVDGSAVQQDGDDVIARFGNYNFGFDIPLEDPQWCDIDKFRVTFTTPGTHDVTVEIYDMMDTPFDGIDPDDILLASYGPKPITILGDFDVTGTIAMQGRTVRSGVPVTLTDVDGAPLYGPFEVFSTSELAYNVSFSGVNGSIYEITTNQARYLNIHDGLDKIFMVNGAYTIPALELKGGNAVWSDNLINIQDASKVGTNYSNPSFEPDADVNFDGRVSIQDLALVGGNYNLTSEVAYADWKPDDDTTVPELDEFFPAEGAVELNTDETFVWTIDALDAGDNLYELEVDHNVPALPEFSVYANVANPFGTAEDKAQFESYGVYVTYNSGEQKWTIDFGETVTDMFVNSTVKFFIKLIDFAGNEFGSMDPTSPENTFEYTISRAD